MDISISAVSSVSSLWVISSISSLIASASANAVLANSFKVKSWVSGKSCVRNANLTCFDISTNPESGFWSPEIISGRLFIGSLF